MVCASNKYVKIMENQVLNDMKKKTYLEYLAYYQGSDSDLVGLRHPNSQRM